MNKKSTSRPFAATANTASIGAGEQSTVEAQGYRSDPVGSSMSSPANSTRDRLLAAARRQFADKGFYGASLASIAQELAVTKQTLLHHFQSKERLYAEVLEQIASDFAQLEDHAMSYDDPMERLEAMILGRFQQQQFDVLSVRIVMRELLDNQSRAAKVNTWYLRPWLDALTRTVQEIPSNRPLSSTEALAIVYQILGASNFLSMSEPTLRGMYGARDFERLSAAYPRYLRKLLRAFFDVEDEGF
ncbi:MAG: TetR/AcrR family transcriptional regulator [Pseudomonadota bacterium]